MPDLTYVQKAQPWLTQIGQEMTRSWPSSRARFCNRWMTAFRGSLIKRLAKLNNRVWSALAMMVTISLVLMRTTCHAATVKVRKHDPSWRMPHLRLKFACGPWTAKVRLTTSRCSHRLRKDSRVKESRNWHTQWIQTTGWHCGTWLSSTRETRRRKKRRISPRKLATLQCNSGGSTTHRRRSRSATRRRRGKLRLSRTKSSWLWTW